MRLPLLLSLIAVTPALAHPIGEEEAAKLPIFDAHIHYKEPAWEVYPPDVAIGLMKKSGVEKALVSSSPDEGTRMLYREDPERIIPFLRPYHEDINSGNWYLRDRVPRGTRTRRPSDGHRQQRVLYPGQVFFPRRFEADAGTRSDARGYDRRHHGVQPGHNHRDLLNEEGHEWILHQGHPFRHG